MADTNQQYSFLTDSGEIRKLNLLRSIGQGSLGTVLYVQDDRQEKYALKYVTSSDSSQEQFFSSNADALLKERAPFSVPIKEKGKIKINGKDKTAILMPYAGNNLSQVLTYLDTLGPKVNDNVREAFAYKTAITVLYALELYETQGMRHGDFQPRNILTSIDLSEFGFLEFDLDLSEFGANDNVELKNSFEQSLLFRRTLLCDRLLKESAGYAQGIGSLLLASAHAGNFLNYIDTDALYNPKLNPDIKPAVRMLQELLWKYVKSDTYENKDVRDHMEVFDFGKTFFKAFNLASNGSKTYPTAKELKERVLEILDSNQDYFILDSDNFDGNEQSQLVLRPIDKFTRVHLDTSRLVGIPDQEYFKSLFDAGEFSLVQILNRGGTKHRSDEKDKICSMYINIIDTRVNELISEIDGRITGKQPFVVQLKDIDEKIKTAQRAHDIAQQKVDHTRETIKKLTIELSVKGSQGEVDETLLGKMKDAGNMVNGSLKDINGYTSQINSLNADIPRIREKMKPYDSSNLEDTLRFVRGTCLDKIKDATMKKNIEDRITNRVG